MRVTTIGYLYQHDEESATRYCTHNSGIITHGHPAAVAASIAAAYLVKLALDGTPIDQFLRKTMLFCDGISDDFDAVYVKGWACPGLG